MNDVKNTVWVFHGAQGRFASGVFTTLEKAGHWIKKHSLTGVLTEYPLDEGVYDWAIENELFDVKKDNQREPAFIQSFTTASQEHFHYENGEID
ncbi:DUF7710 domain-containing protein [Mucilaginibacter sp. McL0603]|uniref:DUF7710 domain-containing protein n=1 Tax=Mucilaginibacter sp. McL0603 TaxID=3415670 RepID=UPI003CF7D9DF